MGLEYEKIGEPLNSYQIGKVFGFFQRSRKYELAKESLLGVLNHIVIRGTSIPVGYLGADNQIMKVNTKDKSLKPHHDYLERLYKIIT